LNFRVIVRVYLFLQNLLLEYPDYLTKLTQWQLTIRFERLFFQIGHSEIHINIWFITESSSCDQCVSKWKGWSSDSLVGLVASCSRWIALIGLNFLLLIQSKKHETNELRYFLCKENFIFSVWIFQEETSGQQPWAPTAERLSLIIVKWCVLKLIPVTKKPELINILTNVSDSGQSANYEKSCLTYIEVKAFKKTHLERKLFLAIYYL